MYVCDTKKHALQDFPLTARFEGDSRSERVHPKQPDNDPMDYKGHGTHVAGIIAGENEWQGFPLPSLCSGYLQFTNKIIKRFSGVAPEAELFIYKVFSDVC